jgi:FMN phosphatase YigB (HAD superfamily)
MNLTVLFDLDDTLITNDMDQFLPVYLRGLSDYNPQIPAKLLSKMILFATQKMTENMDPQQTLETVFDQYFYPGVGFSKAALHDQIQHFYQEGFPNLRGITSPRPEAVKLVDTLLKKGCQVAIATNPLFPQTATYQRLGWAGLPPSSYPFACVSTYESFHFAKPNPAYFAELLAQIGWPDQPVVMVGNSLEDDLKPAASLGLPVYWLNGHSEALPPEFTPPSRSGSLQELESWLDLVASGESKPYHDTPQALLAFLRATPASIAVTCASLSEEQWKRRPAPEEWSPIEILCHLIDVDREVNLPRLQRIALEDQPFLAGIETDGWAIERKYCDQDGLDRLNDLMEVRKEILTLLQALSPAGWQRQARHSIFGPTKITELINIISTHDRVHIRQLHSAIQSN